MTVLIIIIGLVFLNALEEKGTDFGKGKDFYHPFQMLHIAGWIAFSCLLNENIINTNTAGIVVVYAFTRLALFDSIINILFRKPWNYVGTVGIYPKFYNPKDGLAKPWDFLFIKSIALLTAISISGRYL